MGSARLRIKEAEAHPPTPTALPRRSPFEATPGVASPALCCITRPAARTALCSPALCRLLRVSSTIPRAALCCAVLRAALCSPALCWRSSYRISSISKAAGSVSIRHVALMVPDGSPRRDCASRKTSFHSRASRWLCVTRGWVGGERVAQRAHLCMCASAPAPLPQGSSL
jgi:hypothetical protein